MARPRIVEQRKFFAATPFFEREMVEWSKRHGALIEADGEGKLRVPTPDGVRVISPGDWVWRSSQNEFFVKRAELGMTG